MSDTAAASGRAALALALVATTAASITTLTTHRRPTPTVSAQLASVHPLPPRVSRSHVREPIRHARTPRPRPRPRPRLTVVSDTLSTTAYCATGHPTASGKQPRIGLAANNRWPFGTRLHVVGYGNVVVEDRIGSGSDLDLYFGDGPDCEQRALDFGRRQLRVVVER